MQAKKRQRFIRLREGFSYALFCLALFTRTVQILEAIFRQNDHCDMETRRVVADFLNNMLTVLAIFTVK